MLTVRKAAAEQLKHITDEAYYISFNYRPDYVQKVKALPKRRYNPQTREWEIPVKDLDILKDKFAGEKINVEGEVVKIDPPSLPEFDFKTKPFDHQKIGFAYGIKNPAFLLGDEQGLGKTKQAIDIAVYRKQTEGLKKCLVIVGVNGLKHNWVDEIKTHSNETGYILGARKTRTGKYKDGSIKDKADDLKNIDKIDSYFIIVNIESIRSKKKKKDKDGKKIPKAKQVEENPVLIELEKLVKRGIIGMAIIDEVHKVKNAQSQQGKAVHLIKTPYKLAMTGTPLMNTPIDLYNILKWLGEEKGSFWAFRNRYCIMGGYAGKEIVGYRNMEELKARVSRVMLRRKKTDVLDLPAKTYTTDYVELPAKQQQLYREVELAIQRNIDEIIVSPNPLAQLTRLRQATSHPALLSSKVNISGKLDRVKEILEEVTANGGKVVIYSNFEQVIRAIEPELRQYKPVTITGKVSAVERKIAIDQFQNDAKTKVVLGTIGALGTGFTLTAANTVIFIDKPWTPAAAEQAEDRCHRIGTTGTINIITLVAKDTIDERIEEIIYKKRKLVEDLVDSSRIEKQEMVKQLLGLE